jgi:hypothetical protein
MSEKVDPKALLDQLNDMLGRLRKIKSETKDEKFTDKIDDCISDINLATNAIKQNSDGFELQYYQALAKSQKLITGISVKGSMLFFITIVVILFLVAAYVALHWLYPSKQTDTFIWATSPLNYIEVVFWSLFGLLTWAIFNMSDWASSGEHIGLWSNWLIARSLQGVFISIVVIIAVQQIDLGTSPVAKTFIPVVLAFVLGYYSERGREYLEILRDKVFPTNQVPTVVINNTEFTTRKSSILLTGYSTMASSTSISAMSPEGVVKVNNKPPTAMSVDGNGYFCERVDLDNGYNSIKVEVKTSNKKTGINWYEVYYTKDPVLHISAQVDTAGGKVKLSGEVKDEIGNPLKGTTVILKTNEEQSDSVVTDQNGQFSREIELANCGGSIMAFVWPVPETIGKDAIQVVRIKP